MAGATTNATVEPIDSSIIEDVKEKNPEYKEIIEGKNDMYANGTNVTR